MAGRAATGNTPQRRPRHNNFKENVYFEPGKQGRRTGLVLKDSGVRDEHGFEPVSGIFSSPEPSPQRSPRHSPRRTPQPSPQRTPGQASPQRNNGNDTALGSSDMLLQESSIPEVTDTLNLRKTPHPHLPPPKTQTPRRTNIGGSPVRHSSIKPQSRHESPVRPLSASSPDQTNRRLDFDNRPVRASIENSPSPFKPRPARSSRLQKARKSVFDLEPNSPNKHQNQDHDIDTSVEQVQTAVDELFQNHHNTPPSATASASQKRTRLEANSPSHPSSVTRSNKRPRPSLRPQNDHTTTEYTTVEQTEVESEQPDQTTVGQTDVDMDQSELDPTTMDESKVEPTIFDHTEADPTIMDQTEADPTNLDETEVESTTVEQTEVDPTTLHQTEVDYTTVDQTTMDQTMPDQTEFTNAYDETVADTTMADETAAGASMADETVADATPADESVAEDTVHAEETVFEKQAPHSVKKKRQFEVHRQQEDPRENNIQHDVQDLSSPSVAAQDFVPPPEDDVQDEDEELGPLPELPKKRARGKAAAKPRGGRKNKASTTEPRPRSESLGPDGLKKPGPKSLVRLRAGTPAEDEGATTTRSGRTSFKPFKYWANETYLWNHGEVEGIVRADEVEQPKPKRAAPSRKKAARQGPVREDEEEEDDDLLPEAWEQELGVINSTVRVWDPQIGTGSNEEVNEDIAFASTAIKTQDVHGSSFRYAKVMTLPFFGSGMVEIPPNGFKRLKNSRKMQMVFFVHEGKVTVEIEDVQFGMTKGGVWQVPRGNNYAIMNESDKYPAKIFFAQGCEAPLAFTNDGAESAA